MKQPVMRSVSSSMSLRVDLSELLEAVSRTLIEGKVRPLVLSVTHAGATPALLSTKKIALMPTSHLLGLGHPCQCWVEIKKIELGDSGTEDSHHQLLVVLHCA